MILTLHTETEVDYAHDLKKYNGKCVRLHGHTGLIRIWFKGDSSLKDEVGIMVDFGIVKEIEELLDHNYLNDIIGMNPTAENLTEYIYNYIKKKIKSNIKVKVRFYETAVNKKTYCEGGDW